MSIAYNFPRDTFLGFDNIFNTLEQFNTVTPKSQGYPPYNVIKKDDTHFLIEIAVAGFSKNDISLTLEKGELTIKGEQNSIDEDEYLHRGISARTFTKRFTIADTIHVIGADVVDGLLLVGLENQIPEEDKPRIINLGELSKSAKQLLLG